MGKLIFRIERDAVVTENSVDILDTDLDRIAIAYRNLYFSQDATVTRQEVVTKIADVLLEVLKDRTKEYEKTEAVKQALESVPEIQTGNITPVQ